MQYGETRLLRQHLGGVVWGGLDLNLHAPTNYTALEKILRRCCNPRRRLMIPTRDAPSQLKICINKLYVFH